MSEHKGWIGVDLDGTLAEYHGWVDVTHIGDPIPLMAERVRQWLSDGRDIRIFTARVCPRTIEEHAVVCAAIDAWTLKHFGQTLKTTCMKDYSMIELWDDRAVQVIPNTGQRVDGNA